MPKVDTRKFYLSAIQKYGVTPRGVQWNSREHQEIRFDVILSLLPKDLSSSTLVDAGCGFGDLYCYLQKKERLVQKYIGIDMLEEMQSIAQKRTKETILLANICTDPLPSAEYYLCSGALNILTQFESYQFIHNAYKSATKGLIFNLLYGDKESQTYNYFTKEQIESLAQELKVQKLCFKDAYLEHDLTVGFFK